MNRVRISSRWGWGICVAFLTSMVWWCPAAELVNRYSFTSDASDAVGGAHGVLAGGAYISGGAVVLNGSGAYVDLPNGLVAARTNITLEVWVTDNGSGTWSRILDFGFSTGGENVPATGTNYMFITPQNGAGVLRAAITPGTSGNERVIDWAGTRLPIGVLTHVVWTIDAAAGVGRLYVNGALVGENPAMTVYPAMLGYTVNNWLGRSQWSADPYFNGSITEFRIYDGVLAPEEIQQSYAAGPDNCPWDGPVSITVQPQSQTVPELGQASFSVAFTGRRPVTCQWFRNGMAIPGATNFLLVLPSVALTNSGDVFQARLTNVLGGVTYWAVSTGAVLTVVPDTNGPVLLRAASVFPNEVLVEFSENVRPDTAVDVSNYTLTNRYGVVPVWAARMSETGNSVVLTATNLIENELYTLVVSNVCDCSAAANPIAPGSRVSFVATPFIASYVGIAHGQGSFVPTQDGFTLTVSGGGLGGTNDQLLFAWRYYTNDFDIRIRVDAFSFSGVWTRAGLMARSSLATNAAFAAAVAAPNPAGCHFMWCEVAGGVANMSGAFPVNGSYTWLRLRRVGNVFSGYAGFDGGTWEFLGTATVSMPAAVYVGFVLAGSPAGGTNAVALRDFGPGQGQLITNMTLPFEPAGPCSRRTALVITEIMYNPSAAWPGGEDLEFVELWNSGLVTEDLTGHRLAGDIAYTFPAGTKLAPGQFLVIARNPTAAAAFYGVSCLGPYSGRLPNSGGTVRLLNELGGILLNIEYGVSDPWPVAPSGSGHSLVLRRPSYGENDPRAWGASDRIGGSPDAFDAVGPEPARGVVINEFLAHTDPPWQDYIELFNTTTNTVDLSGAWLTDDPANLKFRIPDGTVLGPRSYLVYTESQLGFALAAQGEQILLVNSNMTRVLDAVAFGGQANGVATGRYPDGAPRFHELAACTPGGSNALPLVRPVIINEIMYNPISGDDADEFVELYNRSTNIVSLAGWRLQGGIRFAFPSNAMIWPNSYVVVAKNASNLMTKYPQLNATNTFGDYTGRLRNSSERIALAMPEVQITTNALGQPVTNVFYITVNDVAYHDGGRWGQWSDGWGSSLELIDPRADNTLAPNWADSDESTKAPWTYIDVTEVLENGQTAAMINQGSYYGQPNKLEFFLQGPGEVLVDNVEFRNNGGANLVANGTFESGVSGWTFNGVCRRSFVEAGAGIDGGSALHLVSAARGDTGPNKVWTTLTATVVTNPPNTGTIRAAVRWLKGSPYVLFRLHGHWMEVSRRLNVPANCGTPGLPNSRLVSNAGPAIVEVSHRPVLPASGQPVKITVRVSDPDGVSSVQLRYRVDPATGYSSMAMSDAGLVGDEVPGDGIYTATIPGMGSNTLVAFYIYAVDRRSATSTFPASAPARECLIRWGETVKPGTLGTYRLWLTASNISFWASREINANDPIDATFVYGNSRVVYNVGTMYSGSPFHTPSYNGPVGSFACDYEVNFPPDDKFLGAEAFVLTAFDVYSGNFFHNDTTAQIDLTGNWIARKLGQQYNYRRHIHVVVNGVVRGTIYDDAQQPNSDMLEQYFPDDESGQLRKIEDWFEFADNLVYHGITTATIARVNKATGEIDAKRYRWNWRPRVSRNPDDWAPLTNLIAAVNATGAPSHLDIIRTWMDIPNFLRPIVTHHICGDWDSYGYERGKNMYAYKPDGQPWRLLMWDIELALGSQSRPATDSIYNIQDATLRWVITNFPAIHREYLRAFHEAVNSSLLPGAADPILDERYQNLRLNGVPVNSPDSIKSYIAARRAYLMSVLPNAVFAVTNAQFQNLSGSNVVTLGGTAPLSADTVLVNGVSYPVTWLSVTNWRVTVPLAPGTNLLTVAAVDSAGNPISNATAAVTVNYTGTAVAPEGWVVFNEIMYAPPVYGAAFVELFNAHTNFTFDLGGWSINGLNYTFPPGTLLPPRSYLVLAEDPFLYNQTYGLTRVAFDRFNGRLDPDGETLTLLRPEPGSTNLIVVDRVKYEACPPWPVATNGASIQLVDPAQDNSRVANWSIGAPSTNLPAYLLLLDYTNTWKYMQVSNLDGVAWQSPAFNDASWPAGQGLLACENNPAITPLIKTVLLDPRISTNGMSAGHAYYFRTRVALPGSLAGFTVTASAYVDDGAVFYLNGTEIGRIRMNSGPVYNSTLANAQPGAGDATTPDTFTIPGELFQAGTNILAVSVHQYSTSSSDIVFGLKLEANRTDPTSAVPWACTPGSANSVTATLAPFPPVWLNEVQAENLTGPTDNFGQREPWIELYNAGTSNVDLSGFYLTDSYTNLTRWQFPPGAVIPPGGFMVVWADNEPAQTTSNAFHASFRLTPGTGSVALTRIANGTTQVVDYLNYRDLPANWSYGDVPDGQPFYRRNMFYFTPGGTNNAALPPISVFVNEWMADNASALADPADGNYEDWFELWNAGTNAVDLSGYYLTDKLDNKFKFKIPETGQYVIPPGGFLLVWADEETNQNSTNRPDLHVNFALAKSGEAIGLYAPDGTPVDVVVFGPQQTDVSQGRFPDGAAYITFMPPTPRQPNMLSNTAPSIKPIPNRTLTLGQTLDFVVEATDPDLPGQTLMFALGPGAPPNAAVNPTTGRFIWTPTNAPATNTITVLVTDNGSPPLSASATFTVLVAPRPVVGSLRIQSGTLQFGWESVPGQRFVVECTDDLNSHSWWPASDVILGTGGVLTFVMPVDYEQRCLFFRIRVLEP